MMFHVLIRRRNRPEQSNSTNEIRPGQSDLENGIRPRDSRIQKTGFNRGTVRTGRDSQIRKTGFEKQDHFCLCSAVATLELQAHQHTPGLAGADCVRPSREPTSMANCS
jgi:hypothetical protein